MKKCPICESNIDDSKDSCYICGSSLKDYVIEKKKADSLPSEKHDESNDTAKSGASTFHIIVTGVLVIWVIICFFAHICQTPICSNCGNEETYCECGLNYDMLSYKFDTLYEYTNALNEFSLGRYESAIDLLEGVDRSELIDIGLSIDIDGLIAECNYRIATNYFDIGNYSDAKNIYQSISDYKNSSDMTKECDYCIAMNMLNNNKYEDAKTLFASISDYKDSADMELKCDYLKAKDLFECENYVGAKEIFSSISDYEDSTEMKKECDYQIAIELANTNKHAQAMEIFNKLGSYKDSKSKFSSSEKTIVNLNKNNGYYATEQDVIGGWEMADGTIGIRYYKEYDGSVTSWYNLPKYTGKYYKLEYGIHFMGDDTNGWKRCGIYQRIDSDTMDVYNYYDGKCYTLKYYEDVSEEPRNNLKIII